MQVLIGRIWKEVLSERLLEDLKNPQKKKNSVANILADCKNTEREIYTSPFITVFYFQYILYFFIHTIVTMLQSIHNSKKNHIQFQLRTFLIYFNWYGVLLSDCRKKPHYDADDKLARLCCHTSTLQPAFLIFPFLLLIKRTVPSTNTNYMHADDLSKNGNIQVLSTHSTLSTAVP